MKTMLEIDDEVFRRLQKEAARRGRTISDLVEASLLRTLESPASEPDELRPLPTFHGGGARVDVADRNSLFELMEE